MRGYRSLQLMSARGRESGHGTLLYTHLPTYLDNVIGMGAEEREGFLAIRRRRRRESHNPHILTHETLRRYRPRNTNYLDIILTHFDRGLGVIPLMTN